MMEQGLLMAAVELKQQGGDEAADEGRGPCDAATAAAVAAEVEEALLEAHGGQTSKGYRERARMLQTNLKVRLQLAPRQQGAAHGSARGCRQAGWQLI